MSSLLAAEAVDQAHVEAEVVLDGASECGAEVVGRNPEREVGVEVQVEIRANGKCWASVGGGPETESGRRDAFGGTVELADCSADHGKSADGGLLA